MVKLYSKINKRGKHFVEENNKENSIEKIGVERVLDIMDKQRQEGDYWRQHYQKGFKDII